MWLICTTGGESVKLFQKKPDRFTCILEEIYDISDMLQRQGEYDGKSRYLEIMAKLLLGIDDSLRLLRSYLAFIAGLAISFFIKLLMVSGK